MELLAVASVLAENTGGAAATGLLAFFGVIFCGVFVVLIGIQCVICYIVSSLFKRVPPEHQKQQPGMVWLLLIPLFNLVWIWFVYPKLSQSYQSWAQATGHNEVGDAFATIALILCIATDCCVIPFLNYLAGPASLVLLIVFLVQISTLKAKIAPGT